MTIKFTVNGPPQGKARPRVTRNGTYTPAKTRQYQELIRLEYQNKAKGQNLGTSAIRALIACYYKIPKSTPKYKKAMMLDGRIKPTVKPDADNVAKCVLDALNGMAYKDDNQIVDLTITKAYSINPRIVVELTEVNDGNKNRTVSG